MKRENTTPFQWMGEDLILNIVTQPRSSKDEICGLLEQCIKIRITAPPIDGKANQHLIKFLAKQFKVAKSNILLLSGENSRQKRIKILSPAQVPEMFL